MRVAVLGAGITGVTTAFALLEKGLDVTVFDANRYPAMDTSFANGGQLSASNAEVWNHAGTIAKGLTWLFKRDAPLSISLRPSWRKIAWLAEFIANVPNYRQHTIATARMAVEAREHLLHMAACAGVDFDLERRGILHFYRDRSSFEHARAVTELLREGGVDRRPVTNQEIHAIEPALSGDFYAGFYTASDFSGDIHKFCRGLAQTCERRGVTLRMETQIHGLRTGSDGVSVLSARGSGQVEPEYFDAAVICAGVGSRTLASMVGDRLPIYPVKGYSITVQLTGNEARHGAPTVSLLDEQTKIVASRLGPDRFRVAGTAELNGENRDIRADRIQSLLNWVRDLFPAINTDHVVPWAGLRPMLPGMMPRIGRGDAPGIFYNTGHGHLGWTLSAATAQAVAAAVTAASAGTARRGWLCPV